MEDKWKNLVVSILETVLIFYYFGVTGLLCLAAFIFVIHYFQDRLIYIRSKNNLKIEMPHWLLFPRDNPNGFRDPAQMQLKAENVVIETKDGLKLNGWLVTRPSNKRIVVYFHGNMVGKSDHR